MPWTHEQLEVIYAVVHTGGQPECPNCEKPLKLMRSGEMGAVGNFRCTQCGEQAFVARRNDPAQGQFRDYTEAEKEQIVTDNKAGLDLECPVDGTPLSVEEQRTLSPTTYIHITCRRCGQALQYRRTER